MEKELHIGISREDYITNKRNLLEARADLLELIKKVHTLREIRNQKAIIYRTLASYQASLIPKFEKLKKELPNIKVANKPKEPKIEIKHTSINSESNSLTDELQEIQAKLEELNSM